MIVFDTILMISCCRGEIWAITDSKLEFTIKQTLKEEFRNRDFSFNIFKKHQFARFTYPFMAKKAKTIRR